MLRGKFLGLRQRARFVDGVGRAADHELRKGPDEVRVELSAGLGAQLDECFVWGTRAAVGSVTGHRVEGVADRDDPRGERDGLAYEAVGIAGAIETFVVVSHVLRDRCVEAKREQQALTDALTGLNNRRALLELLRVDEDRALRGRQPLSVILTDVDRFKAVNDDFGHNTGDQVLKVVSDALRAGVRSGDHVGRWGGEEFLMLLPNTDLIQAAEVAERCRALLTRQQVQAEDGRMLRVSASFGVASADGVARPDVMELVSQADRALYWAKEAGRNRVKIYVASADPERRRA